MLKLLRTAATILFVFTLLTGVLYPFGITMLSQALFPFQANGSLIRQRDQIVGSELIGQPFRAPHYFWSRPSSTSSYPYNASASGGSNLGPLNPVLHDAVRARVRLLREADVNDHTQIPVDLVTSSASGLDPHISPAAAYYQVPRVAKARGISESELMNLVETQIEDRILGIWGEPRVNVLRLNRVLDRRSNP